jgi:hypothetical protein
VTTADPDDHEERSSGPVLTAEAIVIALSVLAFVAGVTKRWILDPLSEAFGDLSPDAKSVVAVVVVVGVIAAIAVARLRRRSSVLAAKRVVDQRMDA